MVKVVNIGTMGPQNPIFGIREENIVSRLTEENWQRKAVVRLAGDRPLYLYIARGTTSGEDGKDVEVFCVNAHNESISGHEYEVRLDTLESALRYINGEDGGKLAQETISATVDQHPMQQGPEVIISTIRR